MVFFSNSFIMNYDRDENEQFIYFFFVSSSKSSSASLFHCIFISARDETSFITFRFHFGCICTVQGAGHLFCITFSSKHLKNIYCIALSLRSLQGGVILYTFLKFFLQSHLFQAKHYFFEFTS